MVFLKLYKEVGKCATKKSIRYCGVSILIDLKTLFVIQTESSL